MKTNKTTVIKEHTVEDENTPAVLAYRVGQLEKTTAAGFSELKEQLKSLQHSFVTVKDLEDAKETATQKHIEQDSRLAKLESWNEWAVKIVLFAVISAVLAVVLVKAPIGG